MTTKLQKSCKKMDIRFALSKEDAEKLVYVQDFLKMSKRTDVFRKLLDDKYEEVKTLRLMNQKKEGI